MGFLLKNQWENKYVYSCYKKVIECSKNGLKTKELFNLIRFLYKIGSKNWFQCNSVGL